MKKIFNITLLALVFLLLTACASTTRNLDRGELENNKISKIHLISQDNIEFQKSRSATTTGVIIGGLIGLAIGSGIDSNTNAKRKKALIPILEALDDYDIQQEFSNKLKEQLTGRAFSPEITVSSSLAEDNKKGIDYGLNTLVITGKFALSSKHRDILSNAKIKLKVSEKGKPYGKSLTEKTLGDFEAGQKKQLNSQFWIDNPDQLKSLIDLSMTNLIEKIAYELNIGTPKEE